MQLFLDESFITILPLIKLFAKSLESPVFFKVALFIRKLKDRVLSCMCTSYMRDHVSSFLQMDKFTPIFFWRLPQGQVQSL